MPKTVRYLLGLCLVVFLFTATGASSTPVVAQPPEPDIDTVVENIFAQLTPAERVGQLFIVSFDGNNVTPGSDIGELIQLYRVGGVTVSASAKNFANDQTAPDQVLSLTNALQSLAGQAPPAGLYTATLTITTPIASVAAYNPLPLFVATEHEGDGFPYTQIRQGLDNLPSQMALGATWNREYSRQIGQVVGHDLSLLGVNMLLGPSLDVLDNPRPINGGGLGVRAFGGSPYWVGEMGHAYIQGVHQGGEGRVLTIAKNFPGFGSSDRPINQGVPTILKSLDDMRLVELPPFFRVTALTPDNMEGVTDGLMTVHARYQGLQGNVPVSLDARNLPALLALKEIDPWRRNGGLVLSAPLGAPAALEGISASRDVFPARRLAQDALLAGNDIMLATDFAFPGQDSAAKLANIKDAIGFFQEKYATDANFQAVVDQRVKRILKAKVKVLGPELFQAQTLKTADNLLKLKSTSVDFNQIAQAGVTLIAPKSGGQTSLPNPPQSDENILIFVDDRQGQDCPTCPDFPYIELTALEQNILTLYGPNATGQVSPEQIHSLGYTALKQLSVPAEPSSAEETTETPSAALTPSETPSPEATPSETASPAVSPTETPPAEVTPVEVSSPDAETLLADADWVIFVMLNIDPATVPQSDAMRLLLRNRYDALRNKKLIVYAFNAPYYLDETEISQLTAYYGFYSKMPNYLASAARLLFQQFEPIGASPVGISAVGPLNLNPDPNQIINIIPVSKIDTNGNLTPIDTPPETGSIDLKVGEALIFRTGEIVDRNGNPVPDRTPVNFFRYYPLEGLSLEPLQSNTVNGVAEITIIKERDTPLQVRASSNLAVQSVTFNIGPGIVETPTPTPTLTPTPTYTPSATGTPTQTPLPESTITPQVEPTFTPGPLILLQPPLPDHPVNVVDLLYSVLGSLLIAGIAFTLGEDRFPLEERVRSALVPIASGLVGYIFFTIIAMAFPDSSYIENLIRQNAFSHWVAPLISLLFAVMGLIVWILKPGRIFWKK